MLRVARARAASFSSRSVFRPPTRRVLEVPDAFAEPATDLRKAACPEDQDDDEEDDDKFGNPEAHKYSFNC